ncbi:hypothetical protein, partial [Pseudonocardia lacus]|uniref:hypothetical protein n=1 Tax=Pseudonocardia lacus TaxID=2835865 RepID=UPI001BDCC6A5
VRRGAVVLGRTPDGAAAPGPLRVTDPADGTTTVLEPATAPYFVKRVVGLPGDRVRPRHTTPGHRRGGPVAEVEVPAGTCFVEGEAGFSVDSCAWGPVPLADVLGVVVLRSRRPGPIPAPAADLPPVPAWLAR